ncbi:hypothetical protein [Dickeya oryzae]
MEMVFGIGAWGIVGMICAAKLRKGEASFADNLCILAAFLKPEIKVSGRQPVRYPRSQEG